MILGGLRRNSMNL